MGEVPPLRLRRKESCATEVNSLATKYYQLLKLVKKTLAGGSSPVVGRRVSEYRGMHSHSPFAARNDCGEDVRKLSANRTAERKRKTIAIDDSPHTPMGRLEGTGLCKSPTRSRLSEVSSQRTVAHRDHLFMPLSRVRRVPQEARLDRSSFRARRKRGDSEYQRGSEGQKRVSPLPWSIQSSFDLY